MTKFAKFVESLPFAPRLCLGVFFVCLTIGISIGMSRIATDANDSRANTKSALSNVASSWQVKLATRISAGNSLAAAAAGFAMGQATGPVDLNGTVAQRTVYLNQSRWANLASTLFGAVPGMLSLQLQPGGVIVQGWPNGSFPLFLDNWNRPTAKPAMVLMLQTQKSFVQGPYFLAQGGWGYVTRFPVFLDSTKQLDSFWGVTTSVFRITDILNSFNASTEFAKAGYEWQVFGIDNTNASKPASWITGTPGLDNATWVKDAQVLACPSEDPLNTLYIAVAPVGGIPSGVPPAWQIAAVVCGSFGGALFVSLVLLLMFYLQWASADANRNAPTAAPLCLMFTDIESSTDMWRANPKSMGEATELHHATVREAIAQFGAYEVKTIGDSFMIATKDTVDGVMLAMQIQQALNDAPWPEELSYALIGREKPQAQQHLWRGLRVRIGLHHATDVEPKFDTLKRYWDYYGNDVNCCARVESMAEGGQVLVTGETLAYLRQSADFEDMVARDVSITCYKRNATLKGIDRPFDLYAITPSALTGRVFASEERIDAVRKSDSASDHGSDLSDPKDVTKTEVHSVLKLVLSKLKAADQQHFVKAMKDALKIEATNQSRALFLIANSMVPRARGETLKP